MSQSQKPDFDWKLVHLVAHGCRRTPDGGDGASKEIVELFAQRKFGVGQELLEDLLDHLLTAIWAKRVDINDSSSCRAFPFRATPDGDGDRALLEGLLAAHSLDEFKSQAHSLSVRYGSLPRAREGLLLHSVVLIDTQRFSQLPFYCLFKCDFEDARQLTEEGVLEKVDEIILDRLKKVAMFPFFDGREQDAGRLKIFQASASDYFHELFEVVTPATAKELFQRELKVAVASRHRNRFDDYFVSLPPAKRELFGKERYVRVDDLLPTPEVQCVNDSSCKAVEEKYDKSVRVSIAIDATTKVQTDLSGLNRSFFFAKKNGTRYLIVRGERFVTSGQLSGLDFLSVDDLDTLLPRLVEDTPGEEENDA